VSVATLALLLQIATGQVEAGLLAVREGRYEEGARLLASAPETARNYDALVALGLARGRLGDLVGAGDAFNQAVVLEPRRREARVERGGLRFLQKQYGEAAQDLQRALGGKEDAYVRDLLGSTLLLAGRTEEALTAWNPLGRPLLKDVEVKGLRHTEDRLVRRELQVVTGGLLEKDQFLETRLRLEETGVFDRVRLRTVPATDKGDVVLEIDLAERHGVGPLPDLVARTLADLVRQRVKPRYDNLLGAGVTVSGEYKWQRTQPTVVAALDMVRPLGLPANLHLEARRARPQYDLDGPLGESPFTLRTRGGSASLRRVLAPRTVGQVGMTFRKRTFSVDREDAPPGTWVGFGGGLEQRFLDTQRVRLDGSTQVFRTADALGSDIAFSELRLRAASSWFLRPREPAPIQKSVLAAQVNGAWGSRGMPLDAMFSPGAASEMPLPLRAHRQKLGGILGRAPLGRSLALVNVEMRQRVLHRKDLQAGLVLFYDGGRVGRTAATGRPIALHDVGAGVRLALKRAVLLRVDFGYGLADGKNALTAGVGQVF
jgi:hypothetical protein